MSEERTIGQTYQFPMAKRYTIITIAFIFIVVISFEQTQDIINMRNANNVKR